MTVYYINFVLYMFTMLYAPVLCDFCLARRWKCLPGWAHIAIFFGIAVVPAYLKFSNAANNTTNTVIYYLIVAHFILHTVIMYRDTVWKKLGVLLFIILLPSAGETLTFFLLKPSLGENYKVDYTSMETTMIIVMTILFILVFTAVLMIPWLKLTSHIKLPRNQLLLYGLLALGQVLLIDVCAMYSHALGNRGNAVYIGIGVAVSVAANYVELAFLISQNDREICRKALEELNYQWEVEQQQYEHIEKKNEEVARFRHDAKNRMAVVEELIGEGEYEKACEVCERMIGE